MRLHSCLKLLCVAAILSAVSLGFAASQCPLMWNYLLASSSTNSPEQGTGPLNKVCHNGIILCLPPNAYQAHLQHGDQPLGPCNKEGELGSCKWGWRQFLKSSRSRVEIADSYCRHLCAASQKLSGCAICYLFGWMADVPRLLYFDSSRHARFR